MEIAPHAPTPQSFFDASARVLSEMLESVSAGADAAQMYRELDAYRHLQKLQARAVASGDPLDQTRFFEEAQTRRAALVGGLDAAAEQPGEEQIAEFRAHVRTWFQLDSELREMQKVARDKRLVKNKLRDVIVQFMQRYNVEELRTQDGRLRFETRSVRRQPTRSAVQENIQLLLKDRPALAEEVSSKAFAPSSVQTTSLKRLR